jgi:flagellar protein FlgJ
MTPYASPLSTPGAGAMFRAQQAASAELSPAAAKNQAKAKATAQDFEAVFLNQMFQQMFTGIDGEGPFGGGQGVGIWRSFLTEEYAKSFAKGGGIGIGDQVYRELIARQSAQPVKAAQPAPYAAQNPGATP